MGYAPTYSQADLPSIITDALGSTGVQIIALISVILLIIIILYFKDNF